MEPIDFVIKLEAAYGIAPDVFKTMVFDLYCMPNNYACQVMNILKDECPQIYEAVYATFYMFDIRL